jgi:hypothetical protein
VIANCPGCGTHYKHEPPKVRVRARCGRCDASLDLGRLSPYRIVSAAAPTAEQARRAASHLPIGLDHPALAITIAENVARNTANAEGPPVPVVLSVQSPKIWENEDPLPQIPEMTLRGAYPPSVRPVQDDDVRREDSNAGLHEEALTDPAPEGSSPEGGGAATFALWLVSGAIAGTGASWTMGGTTITGMAAGAAFGAVAGWVWLRWTSQR